MTDLPYTYTDVKGTRLTVTQGLIGLTVEGTGAIHFHLTADAPDLARAVLTAAGDTGHEVVRSQEREDDKRTIRTLYQQRADLRARVRDVEAVAESMRERAAEVADQPAEWSRLESPGDRIRALPLLPDGDTTEGTRTMRHCVLCASGEHQPSDHDTPDAQLPDRNGDVIDDIVIALTRREDLSDEHRAFYMEVFDRFEALTSERDRLRTAWESARHRARLFLDRATEARAQLDDARRWGRILEAQRKDLRKKLSAETDRVAALRIAYQAAKNADLPEEDMVEPGDEVSDRVGALEKQYTDLADLVHGHGEDLTRLRRRYTAQDDG